MNDLANHFIKYQFVSLFLATFFLAASPCHSYALLMTTGRRSDLDTETDFITTTQVLGTQSGDISENKYRRCSGSLGSAFRVAEMMAYLSAPVTIVSAMIWALHSIFSPDFFFSLHVAMSTTKNHSKFEK